MNGLDESLRSGRPCRESREQKKDKSAVAPLRELIELLSTAEETRKLWKARRELADVLKNKNRDEARELLASNYSEQLNQLGADDKTTRLTQIQLANRYFFDGCAAFESRHRSTSINMHCPY